MKKDKKIIGNKKSHHSRPINKAPSSENSYTLTYKKALFAGTIMVAFLIIFAMTSQQQKPNLAPLKDPMKTVEFFIVQDTDVGIPNWTGSGSGAKPYDVFIAEYNVGNTAQVELRNAYVKITGIAKSAAPFSVEVKVNDQTPETYNFPSTDNLPLTFNVNYNVTSLNYDYPGNTSATNNLEIDFPTPPDSVSLLGAKQIVTYSINTVL